MRVSTILVGGSLVFGLAACNGKGSDTAKLLTYKEATACIDVSVDPELEQQGFVVYRLTNTCQNELNVAYCVTEGREPVCTNTEQPALSYDEWTRAYVTEGSDGTVSVGACEQPEQVQTGEETWYCEETN